jgi:F-type H+-transporting ATPase subunit b
MLDFNYTIFIQFLNLLVLLILLHFLLFKPILKALSKRQSAIHSLEEKAETSKKEVDGLGRVYEERIKERKHPIIEGREAALKEAHSASMKVIEEARRELTEELAKIKDSVRQEADKTLEALKSEADRLSSEIVQKILKRGTR